MLIHFLLIFFALVHCLYWIFIFDRINRTEIDSDVNQDDKPFISIVVVFKNELDNLQKLIPKLLEQSYPNYELLLCDDFSEDNSLQYLSSIRDARLKILTPSKDLPGKKLALKESVAAALGEYILVTDADCITSSNLWISTMHHHTNSNSKIILGYSPHLREPGFLNKFIRYETFLTALQYLSYALMKLPYMGVGRNMMYSKKLMLDSSFFKTTQKIVSGDDDLFVNEVATPDNTAVCLNKNSFINTYAAQSFNAFLGQKKRHLSTGKFYKMSHVLLLSIYSMSHLLTYFFLIVHLFLGNVLFSFCAYLFFILFRWIICQKAMTKLALEDLKMWFPILDLVMASYYLCMFPFTLLNSKRW